ncbi:MAG: aromatic amino acid lyase [Calditrichia bacterium]
MDPKTKQWELTNGRAAMKQAGIPQVRLEAKEGLALNNGTQVTTAIFGAGPITMPNNWLNLLTLP